MAPSIAVVASTSRSEPKPLIRASKVSHAGLTLSDTFTRGPCTGRHPAGNVIRIGQSGGRNLRIAGQDSKALRLQLALHERDKECNATALRRPESNARRLARLAKPADAIPSSACRNGSFRRVPSPAARAQR